MTHVWSKRYRAIQMTRLGRDCRDDYLTFLRTFWPVLNPSVPLVEHDRMRAVVTHAQAWVEGAFRRVGCAMAPGQSKSSIWSIYLPVWIWLRDPAFKLVSATHSLGLSWIFMEKRRILIESERFQRIQRPPWSIGKTTTASKSRLMNSAMGEIRATAVGAAITGEHFGAGVLDDLLTPAQAYGPQRIRHVQYWDDTLQSRFEPRHDPMIAVPMQRLCEGDIFDEFSKRGFFDCRLILPAVYEAKIDPGPTPLGWSDDRKPGELLDPVRIPQRMCDELKAMKPRTWTTQYQQSPVSEDGGLIPSTWWRWYKVLPQGVETVGWDLSYGADGEDNDMCSGQAWVLSGADLYLTDLEHGVWDFNEQMKRIRDFAKRRPRAARTLLEKKANGAAALTVLQRDIPGLMPWTPQGPKETRVGVMAGWVESGHMWLPDPEYFPHLADRVAEFIHQCAAFGSTRYDDLPDCASMVALAQGRQLGGASAGNFSLPTLSPSGNRTTGLRKLRR